MTTLRLTDGWGKLDSNGTSDCMHEYDMAAYTNLLKHTAHVTPRVPEAEPSLSRRLLALFLAALYLYYPVQLYYPV